MPKSSAQKAAEANKAAREKLPDLRRAVEKQKDDEKGGDKK